MTFDLVELPKLLTDLYAIVKRLEELAPGRRFTPDGHLVGSIGEAVAAYAYGLELLRGSNKGHDARTAAGDLVQIKLTQGRSIALSHPCDFLLVLRLDRQKGFQEVYNGPGEPVWAPIAAKAALGLQRQVSLATIARLATGAAPSMPLLRPYPAILPAVIEVVMAGESVASLESCDAAAANLPP